DAFQLQTRDVQRTGVDDRQHRHGQAADRVDVDARNPRLEVFIFGGEGRSVQADAVVVARGLEADFPAFGRFRRITGRLGGRVGATVVAARLEALREAAVDHDVVHQL